MELRKQRYFNDIDLKSSTVDENTKPTAENWLKGAPLKSNDTILSAQLFHKNAIIMAKIINKQVK